MSTCAYDPNFPSVTRKAKLRHILVRDLQFRKYTGSRGKSQDVMMQTQSLWQN